MPETCGLDITLHARFLRGACECHRRISVIAADLYHSFLYSPPSIRCSPVSRPVRQQPRYLPREPRILMPLHVLYSPSTVSRTSMLRASVSSLVESSGSKWLWVHAILIWWITITWTATVLWITWGGLAYRRREISRLAERVKESRMRETRITGGENGVINEDAEGRTVADDSEGIKRFRTIMVTNVPPDSENLPPG